MKKLTRGILISIEGIDGSGKSTLANHLKQSLAQENLPVILTYEPGDTEIGKQLRRSLQERPIPLCNKTEYLLYAADRAQHFCNVIIPSLKQNKLIISDRLADSSVAYQGYGRGLDLNIIQSVNSWAMENIKPELTLYIKISIDSAIERLKKRKGRPTSIEQEKETFTKKVIHGFNTILDDRSGTIILDGEQTEEILHKTAHANIMKYLKDKQLIA